MNDFEQQVRAGLAELADGVEPVDLVDAVTHGGRRRRRRRTWTAAAATAVTVAGGAGAATLVVRTGGSPHPVSVAPAPGGRSSAPPDDGVPDASFRVAAPVLSAPAGGGPPMVQRPCRPATIDATAVLRSSPYGSLGVVTMHGAHCSLHVWPGPTQLLDAKRQPIATAAAPPPYDPSKNPPGNLRPDSPLYAGNAAWGFAWRGSWCGAPARYVVVPLQDQPFTGATTHRYGHLVVALSGPQLPCTGASHAQLVPGIPGGVAEPVQTPPPAWQALRLSLDVAPAAAHDGTIDGVTVVIRNTSGSKVSLDPCPDVEVDTGESDPRGSERDSRRTSLPGCGASTVVPAHGKLRFRLPPQEYGGGSPLGNGGASRGSRVTIVCAIAGVPTATATTRVR